MIYMDNAATTCLSPSVIVDICRHLDNYGNPSSLYDIGYKSKDIIEQSRIKVANAINAEPEQIFFTSGATESNNWVTNMFDHIVANTYEHHSITAQPNFINIENYREKDHYLDDNVFSCMLVNNETGFVNNIKKFYDIYKSDYTHVHSDLTQAIGNITVDVKDLNIDYGSFSGHKFHAPKGIGVLYVKEPNKLKPYHYGGQQESHKRAGTENIIGISAIGVAIEEVVNKIDEKQDYCAKLRRRFIYNLDNYNIDYIINGGDIPHISSILSLSFRDQDSSSMLIQLDEKAICCSSGSACNSGDSEPSETLKYLKVPKEYINGTLRFSFSLDNTIDEVDYVCYNINRIIKGGN